VVEVVDLKEDGLHLGGSLEELPDVLLQPGQPRVEVTNLVAADAKGALRPGRRSLRQATAQFRRDALSLTSECGVSGLRPLGRGRLLDLLLLAVSLGTDRGQLCPELLDKLLGLRLLAKPSRQIAFEPGEHRVQDLDQDVRERVLLEILAVQIDRSDGLGEILSSVVKKQCLSAPTARKHHMILLRTHVVQDVPHVDVRDRVGPALLNSQTFRDRAS
jgi:hypothetical protein